MSPFSNILSSSFLCATHDTSLLIVGDALLEEVCLSCKGDILHDYYQLTFRTLDITVEWVCRIVVFLIAECKQETVGDEFDVLFHEFCIDSQQWTRQTVSQKSLLNCDGFGDDVLDGLLAGAFAEMAVEETGEVGVETFVSRNEFV